MAERSLKTGDVVTNPSEHIERKFVVLDPHPPGALSEILCDVQKQERLALPGTHGEGVEDLEHTGDYWPLEKTLAAYARSFGPNETIAALIRQRYELPPYQIPE